jgi:hypothetical protein
MFQTKVFFAGMKKMGFLAIPRYEENPSWVLPRHRMDLNIFLDLQSQPKPTVKKARLNTGLF